MMANLELRNVRSCLALDALKEEDPRSFSLVFCAVFTLLKEQIEPYKDLEDVCMADIVQDTYAEQVKYLLYVPVNNKELHFVQGKNVFRDLTSCITGVALYNINKKKYFVAILVDRKALLYHDKRKTGRCIAVNDKVKYYYNKDSCNVGTVTKVVYKPDNELFNKSWLDVYTGKELEDHDELTLCTEEDALYIKNNPHLLYIMRDPDVLYEIDNDILIDGWRILRP